MSWGHGDSRKEDGGAQGKDSRPGEEQPQVLPLGISLDPSACRGRPTRALLQGTTRAFLNHEACTTGNISFWLLQG